MASHQSQPSNRWCFTLCNPVDDLGQPTTDITECDQWTPDEAHNDAIVYLIVGHELAPTTGTPHLQGYIRLSGQKRLGFVRDICSAAHWEQARGSHKSNVVYCKKDGDWHEQGEWKSDRDGTNAETKEAKIERSKRLLDHSISLAALVDEGTLSAYCVTTIKKARLTILQEKIKAKRTDTVRGIWIHGPPGTGKTHYVHETYGDSLFVKQQNKWWDGYLGEETVLIDDMDTDTLAHHLKLWADKYAHTAEIKGGTVPLEHDRFIVTSNFSIEELFRDKPQRTQEALLRRFEVKEFNDVYEP